MQHSSTPFKWPTWLIPNPTNMLQGGENPLDVSSFRSLGANEPLFMGEI